MTGSCGGLHLLIAYVTNYRKGTASEDREGLQSDTLSKNMQG